MSKGFTNIKNVTIVNEVHNKINKGKKIVTEIKDIITLIISYFSIFGAVDLLQKKLIKIITESSDKFENFIKREILLNVNNCISCNITQKIPNEFFYDGLKINIKHLDIFNLFKVDPNSDEGKQLYFDIESNRQSKDFNVFIYHCIKNPNIEFNWFKLLNIKFLPYDTLLKKKNILHIKIHESYLNKDLKNFNSDFSDSLILIDKKNVLSSVLNFSFNFNKKKTTSQLYLEEEIKFIVEDIINSDDDEDTDIDENGVFSLKNNYDSIIENVTKQKFGLLNTKNIQQSYLVDEVELNKFTNEIIGSEDMDNVNTLTENFLNKLQTPTISADIQNTDMSNRINIVKNLFRGVLLYFSCLFFSPKILLLVQLQLYTMAGTVNFKDGIPIKILIEYLKKAVIKPFIKKISELIVNEVTSLLLVIITEQLVNPILKRKIPEKIKERILQFKTLTISRITDKTNKLMNE